MIEAHDIWRNNNLYLSPKSSYLMYLHSNPIPKVIMLNRIPSFWDFSRHDFSGCWWCQVLGFCLFFYFELADYKLKFKNRMATKKLGKITFWDVLILVWIKILRFLHKTALMKILVSFVVPFVMIILTFWLKFT